MLPTPRTPGRYKIALVCLGNICRSPMAHVVLQTRLAEAGLDDIVEIASSGTGDWHVGHPMDKRAAATLASAGYDATQHRARLFDSTWHDDHDLVLAMDLANLSDVGGLADRTLLFRDFDPVGQGGEVPDPYYGGPAGFQEVLHMIERTSESLVEALREELGRA